MELTTNSGFLGSLGIVPTFLKLDSWSPGATFYSHFHQGKKSDKEKKI